MNFPKINVRYKILAACLLFFLALGLGGGITWVRYYFGAATQNKSVLLLPTGSNFDQLMDSLAARGTLCDSARFRRVAMRQGLDARVRPGRYLITPGMSYATLTNTLKSGRQSPVMVTFNNLRTMDRLAGAVSKRLEVDSLTLLQALRNDSLITALGYTPQTFLAMFIPNSYEFYWTTTPDDFLKRIKRESDNFWNEARQAKLSRSGLSRIEAAILASIVYEETKRESEMARVAGVYINRLRVGMPLQADPTVKFALGDFAIKRVLNKHLEVNSPYNTYKRQGLPPGPICMPSVAALEAVIDFEENPYFYFCAKDDLSGAHNFAKTLTEHNKNARAYAQALNRLKIR